MLQLLAGDSIASYHAQSDLYLIVLIKYWSGWK